MEYSGWNKVQWRHFSMEIRKRSLYFHPCIDEVCPAPLYPKLAYTASQFIIIFTTYLFLMDWTGCAWWNLIKKMTLSEVSSEAKTISWHDFFFHGLVVTCFAGLKRSSVAVKFLVPLAMSTLQKHHKCLTAIVDLERCCKCGRKKTKGKKGLAFSSLWLWQILKWHSYAFIGVIYCCSGGRTSCIPQILLC